MRNEQQTRERGGLATYALAFLAVAGFGQAQTVSPGGPTAKSDPGVSKKTPPNSIAQTAVPGMAREFLVALGDRLQTGGKERFVLIGQYTTGAASVPATITWEAPGNLRFERNGAATLAVDTKLGVLNSSRLADAEADVIESLLDDRPEAFLYGLTNGYASRLLGTRFRTDDGKTANYTGPWYDIYQVSAPLAAAGKTVTRQKLFFFDSQTKLLARATYVSEHGGSKTTVSTEYSGWTKQDGQAVPGQIVRKENGTVVFTFRTNASTLGAAAADGVFARP